MPRKGAYHLAPSGSGGAYGAASGPTDSSFAACIGSLLVFLAICIIIICATYPWMKKIEKENHKQGDDFSSSHQHGDKSNPKKNVGKSTTTTTVVPEDISPDYSDELPIERHELENQTTGDFASTTESKFLAVLINTTDQNNSTSRDDRSMKLIALGTTTPATTTGGSTVMESSPTLTESTNAANENMTTTPAELTSEQNESTSEQTVSTSEQSDQSRSESTQNKDVRCTTQHCKRIASRMLSLMDVTADPCTNFYNYACGDLRENREMVEADPEARVDDRLLTAVQKINLAKKNVSIKHRFFKSFYEKCISYEHSNNYTERLEKAIEYVKEAVGTFNDSSTISADDLTDILVKLFQHNSALLFDVMLEVSEGGKDAPFTLKLVPPQHQGSVLHPFINFNAGKCFGQMKLNPGEAANLENIYDEYATCKGLENDFVASIKNVLEEFRAFEAFDEADKTKLITDTMFTIDDLLRSSIFSQATLNEAGVRINVLNKVYIKMTLAELQNEYSMVNWVNLLKDVLGANSTHVTSSTVVHVYIKDYFDKLFETIGFNADGSKIPNALLAMYAHSLYVDLVQEQGGCDRSKMCLSVARNLMDDIASFLYHGTFVESRLTLLSSKVTATFSNIINVLVNRIETSTKVKTEADRTFLKEKLKKMSLEVGTKKLINKNKILTEKDVGADYFEGVMIALKRRRIRMYADFKTGATPAGHTQIWSHFSVLHKTSANAVYDLNTILVPLGMLTSPVYLPGAPAYINMGTLGTIVAHEISHHFDSTGIKYDSDGKRQETAISNYEDIFQDLSTQLTQTFSSEKEYQLANGGKAIYNPRPELSKNERFADVSAIDLAFDTYKDEMLLNSGDLDLPYLEKNWKKNFFISHAQMFCTKRDLLDYRVQLYEGEHLPPLIRVNMVASSSRNFLDAFQCAKPTPNFIISI